MYQLIAIDLDGTLLNSYGEISKENKEAIRRSNKTRNYSCFSISEECHKLLKI